MTYPVDDAGNPRVDFVWGNFPLQPDQQRDTYNEYSQTTDGNWTNFPAVGSSNLDYGWDVLTFSTGDGGGSRQQTFEYDSHDIATTGYSNYPAFLPDYAGDGDTGLEFVVPNIVGLTYSAAGPIITAAGFIDSGSTSTYVGATVANDGLIKTQSPVAGAIASPVAMSIVTYNAPEVPNVVGLTESAANTALLAAHVVKGAVTTANNAAGATALNNGLVKTQTPAAGTTVDTGSSVALVKYAYTVTANTNVAGFSNSSFPGHLELAGGEVYMFLTGRTTKPTVGATITTAGNANTSLNRNWTVNTVEDNDSYNTGGTVCKLTALTGGALANPNTNATVGTWVLA
jgi:hypothetical protein